MSFLQTTTGDHGGDSFGLHTPVTPKPPMDQPFLARSQRTPVPSHQKIFAHAGPDEQSPRASPMRGGKTPSGLSFGATDNDTPYSNNKKHVHFATGYRDNDASAYSAKRMPQSPYDSSSLIRPGSSTPAEHKSSLPFESYDDDLDGPMEYSNTNYDKRSSIQPRDQYQSQGVHNPSWTPSTPADVGTFQGMNTPQSNDRLGVYKMSSGYGPRLIDSWVTVFGFRPEELANVLQVFRNQVGEVLNVKHPRDIKANWVHIQYATVAQAERALAKSGIIINGNTMIAVKPFEGPEDGSSNMVSGMSGMGMATPAPSTGMRTPGTQGRQHPMPVRDYTVEKEALPQAQGSTLSRVMDYVFGI